MKAPNTEVNSIAVYICTHMRNGPLVNMLESLVKAAERVQPTVEIACVVVDDNPDGKAKEVVDSFSHNFIAGLHYRFSGSQNISVARNIGMEAAMELCDWVAMVDDDQTVVESWFDALIQTQAKTGADAVTGPVYLRYPKGSPSWLTNQPFDSILEAEPKAEGAKVEVCSTGNSMLRSSFLINNPEIRFRGDLGKLGGEDMVFYRQATSAGLIAHYSTEAVAYGEQPPERSTFKFLLRASYWMGNTEYLTNIESRSASRGQMFLRASKRMVFATLRPFKAAISKKPPQWRFGAARVAQSFGIFVGIVGVKVRHK